MTDALMAGEWLAAPRKRSRLRTLLVVLLAAAVCFLGGALVQKHLGSTDSTATGSAGGPPAGAMQLPQGLPDLAQSSGASTSSDDGASVIGKVVAVRDGFWVVRDLAGKKHRVPVTKDTEVVRESPLKARAVKVGDTVDVSGDIVTLR